MTMGMVAALRNSMLDEITTRIDAGTGAGKVRLYDGTRPATGGAATTLLAELPLSDPSAAAASAGVLTLNAITDDSSADATGTATWYRILDSDDVFVLDGDVGAGDMVLTPAAITAGAVVSLTSWTITAGNA